MKKIYCILLSILLICTSVSSQILINNNSPNNSPSHLINNILLGGGVSASNHFFQGDSSQIGYFNGVNSNIGIDSGIVLSTGSIFDLIGPNSSGSTTTGFSLPGDPTIDAVIAPDPSNDAAVLEFDFVATSDTISFKYVFGSEEYLEWVNSFNDAFGFFLSGPNPAGGNYIDHNLAIIPGTTTPVTIDNVNDVINSTYYIDNGDGFIAPQNTDSTVIQFDGFTTPLTALASVNCGETYHIKLVVADAVDDAYDSGIFLESKSFSSAEPGAVNIEISTTDAICNGDSSGTVSIACVQGVTPPYTTNWNGINPNSLFAGTYSVEIIDANGINTIQFYVINEPAPIVQNIDHDGIILSSNVTGGTPSYSYSWLFNNTIVASTMSFSPTQNGDYFCIVTDINGCSDTSESININNIPSGLDNYNSSSILIYPNPFNTKTTIKLIESDNNLKNIILYDYLGREVILEKEITTGNQVTLEKGNLLKGAYILLIETDNFTSKILLILN